MATNTTNACAASHYSRHNSSTPDNDEQGDDQGVCVLLSFVTSFDFLIYCVTGSPPSDVHNHVTDLLASANSSESSRRPSFNEPTTQQRRTVSIAAGSHGESDNEQQQQQHPQPQRTPSRRMFLFVCVLN
jgi:hypothetical protein